MKRLLAFAALMLGLATLVSPAQARVFYSGERAEVSRVEPCAARTQAVCRENAEDDARSGRSRRSGDGPVPTSRRPRTVLLPTVMLVDRPLE